jgi:hypothetical protein
MKLKKVMLDTYLIGGNQKPQIMETVFDTELYKESGARLKLVKYKTMQELIQENPDHYFDKYGNFCRKRDHIPPSYFSHLGHTVHHLYMIEDGIPQDTWYYKVLDY